MTTNATTMGSDNYSQVAITVGGSPAIEHHILDGHDFVVVQGATVTEVWEINPNTNNFIGTTPIYKYSSYGVTGQPADGYGFVTNAAGSDRQDPELATVTDSSGNTHTYMYTWGRITDDPTLPNHATDSVAGAMAIQIQEYDHTTDTWSFVGYQYGQEIGKTGGPYANADYNTVAHFASFEAGDGNHYAYVANEYDATGTLWKLQLNNDTGEWQKIYTSPGVPKTITSLAAGGEAGAVNDNINILTNPTDGSQWIVWDNKGTQGDWNDNFSIAKLDASGNIIPSTTKNIDFYSDLFTGGYGNFGQFTAGVNLITSGSMTFDPNGNLVIAGGQHDGTGGVLIIDPKATTFAGMIKAAYTTSELSAMAGAGAVILDGQPIISFNANGEMIIVSTSDGGNQEGSTYTLVFDTINNTYRLTSKGFDQTWGYDGPSPSGSSAGGEYGAHANELITLSNGTTLLLQANGTSSGTTPPAYNWMTLATTTFQPICFVAGTHIRTGNGEIAVEDLAVGDLVETLDHGLQPIRWIGSTKRIAKGNLAPILIRAGTLGNDRDLRVSPQHRMLIQGWQAELLFGEPEALVAAKHLLNDHSVIRVEGGEVEYFHILFDQHEIIYSEGALSESFHPGAQSAKIMAPEQVREILALFPELEGDFSKFRAPARLTLNAREGKLVGSEILRS